MEGRLRVVIAGGTGAIGAVVAGHLRGLGHEVVVVTRRVTGAGEMGGMIGGWGEAVRRSDGVVNLAGENIWSGRWTAGKKRKIRESRVEVLERLMGLMAAGRGPRVFVNGSGIAYYGTAESREILDEAAGAGAGFLAEVCQQNEEMIDAGISGERRVVHLRIGVTLLRGGVALRRLGRLSRWMCVRGIGREGVRGAWFSWIHVGDVAGLADFSLRTAGMRGAVNATAPGAVRLDEVMGLLGERFGRLGLVRMPGMVARLALGEASEVVLRGSRVFPRRALDAGYRFAFPGLDLALRDLLGRG